MQKTENLMDMKYCPKCGNPTLMKVHINSDWVNGPSCIMEADGCYCMRTTCTFVCGEGPWQERARKWNARQKTWLNQYGQLVKGSCREDETKSTGV